MKTSIFTFAYALLLTLFPAFSTFAAATDRYVVVFEDESPADAAAIIEAAAGLLVNSFAAVGVVIATSSSVTFAEDVEAAPEVEACSLMQPRSLSELYGEIETPAFPGQWSIQRVSAEQAWPVTTGSHETVVAVIDTGIAVNHPELATNVVDATCFAAEGICQNYPIQGHGTEMAGLIAAVGQVITGVGPDLGLASLNVIEFLDLDDDGIPETPAQFDEAVWEALFYAAQQGYEVATMAFGSQLNRDDPGQRALLKAWRKVVNEVRRQGVTLIASAGNDGLFIADPVVVVPAGLHGVAAVGATAVRPLPIWPQPGGFDIRAFYSNTGDYLTLAAPGGDCGLDVGFDPCDPSYLLVSTNIDLMTHPSCIFTADCPPTYTVSGGTSGAAAMASGAAGLVIDAWNRPQELKPRKVIRILTRTADPIGSEEQLGAGMINVAAAVADAAGLR